MNSEISDQTWVGVAFVVPIVGSAQQQSGLKAGYGFVAYRAANLLDGISALRTELAEGGSDLVGFEWLFRLEDNERELRDSDLQLLDKLTTYPIQFRDFEWFDDS